jgi:predicted dehydrogenase
MNPSEFDAKSRVNRRRFVKRGLGALAVGSIGFPAVVSSAAPNSKLNIAGIGVGGRGGHNIGQMAGENVVAICDVNAHNLAASAKKFPNARPFRDFRELYAADMDFDAVVVSTTEHTHAFATLPALKRGKHVYCEKPLTRDVYEARMITEAAAKAGVATQMGTQIHAGDNYRRVVELIQSGAIGTVSEAHVWVSRAWGWQGKADAEANRDLVWSYEPPKESMPVPDHVDWDLWIGPAPWRPYHEIYFPGPKWYRWWDFGNGTMSDLGSHWNDLPFWALNLDAPTSVRAWGPPPHPEIAPASMSAEYTYPAREGRAGLKLTWHQGANKPDIWKRGEIPQWGNGVLFIGDEGMLLSDYGKHVLLPEGRFLNFKRPDPWIPKSIGHHQEWIHACKTGAPTTCHFGYAGPLTEANHLGNVAYRIGKTIEWDHAAMRMPNLDLDQRYLKREYRDGWTLA